MSVPWRAPSSSWLLLHSAPEGELEDSGESQSLQEDEEGRRRRLSWLEESPAPRAPPGPRRPDRLAVPPPDSHGPPPGVPAPDPQPGPGSPTSWTWMVGTESDPEPGDPENLLGVWDGGGGEGERKGEMVEEEREGRLGG